MALAIMYMYPNIVNLQDFVVMDNSDGQGQFISEWHYSQPKPTEVQLQSAWLGYCKQAKLAELNDACQNTIYGGFTGTNGHKYQFEEKDQGNLTQQMLFLVNDPTITSVQWKTIDSGIVAHTRAQFLQVCNDANNFKRLNFGKYWQLEVKVDGCTTEDEINNIGW